VTLSAKRSEPTIRPIDRHLASVAAERGGLYELASEAARQSHHKGAIARLRQLEKLGLASLERPDRWRVGPGLVEELERRQREAPRYRQSVQAVPLSLDDQVVRRGPVWLDQVAPTTLSSRGFGADVRAALERRHGVLRELGIAPEDPERDTKLRELERRAVGRKMADHGQGREIFVESTPNRFRGRAAVLVDGLHVAVTDGRRFVLIEATPEARAMDGRVVELHRDASGRLALVDEQARRELGEKLAHETRRTFLPTIPAGLRGDVQDGPKGSPFLVVSDGARFALILDTADARALVGKRVEVTRDPAGLYLGLRPDDRDRNRGLGR
jgi:hypothetical protein